MNKVIIILIIIALVGGYFFMNQKNNTATTLGTTVTPTVMAPQKFTDSNLASIAYQIFPGPMSAETVKAIAGFNIKTTPNADATTLISLTSTNPEYKDQQYTVKPGEILYFIEKNPGDDSENKDKFMADDTAVLVDANGFIITR